MKLFRSIAVFDVVVAAEDEEDARVTLQNWISGYGGKEEPLPPNEATAREIRERREIRAAMVDVKPIVGEKVTDEDFEKLKGCTNMQAFEKFYEKKAPEKK